MRRSQWAQPLAVNDEADARAAKGGQGARGAHTHGHLDKRGELLVVAAREDKARMDKLVEVPKP